MHRWRMTEHTDIHSYTHPGQDGEEAEGDGGSGSVRALGQWQLLRRGSLPLIGQKTEANKPQEAGNTWVRDKEQSKQMSGVMYLLPYNHPGVSHWKKVLLLH